MDLLASQSLQISLFRFLLLKSSFVVPSKGQVHLGWFCPRGSNEVYAPNSTYKSNLLSAFANLTSLSSSHSFGDAIAGSGTGDQVYAVYDCRGDTAQEMCHACVQNATAKVPQACPSKQAVIAYRECVLGYATRPVASVVDLDLSYKRCALPVTGDGGAMNRTVMPVLEQLIANVTSETSSRYFGVARTNYSVRQEIKCLVQCAPVLSRTQCKECLLDAYNSTIAICASKGMLAGLQSGPRCQIRYGIPSLNLSSGPAFPPLPQYFNTSRFNSSGSHALFIISDVKRFLFLVLFCLLLA